MGQALWIGAVWSSVWEVFFDVLQTKLLDKLDMLLAYKDLRESVGGHEIGGLPLDRYTSIGYLLPQPMLVNVHIAQSGEQLVLVLGDNAYCLQVVAIDGGYDLEVKLNVLE